MLKKFIDKCKLLILVTLKEYNLWVNLSVRSYQLLASAFDAHKCQMLWLEVFKYKPSRTRNVRTGYDKVS